jgi:uncharacterized protein
VGDDEPVTTEVTRRIKPGHEAAYEAFLDGISAAARRSSGFLGVEVFRPPSAAAGDYRIVYRFDSRRNLQRWPGLAGPRGVARAGRAARGRADAGALPHRSGELVHAALAAGCAAAAAVQDGGADVGDHLPADHGIVIATAPLIGSLPVVPRLAITTLITVPVMTWVVMPRVTRLLRGWLYPRPRR